MLLSLLAFCFKFFIKTIILESNSFVESVFKDGGTNDDGSGTSPLGESVSDSALTNCVIEDKDSGAGKGDDSSHVSKDDKDKEINSVASPLVDMMIDHQ